MSERVKGFIVTLVADVYEEDVQDILTALRMVKGVASVEAAGVNSDDFMNRERIRIEYKAKVYEALKP